MTRENSQNCAKYYEVHGDLLGRVFAFRHSIAGTVYPINLATGTCMYMYTYVTRMPTLAGSNGLHDINAEATRWPYQ